MDDILDGKPSMVGATEVPVGRRVWILAVFALVAGLVAWVLVGPGGRSSIAPDPAAALPPAPPATAADASAVPAPAAPDGTARVHARSRRAARPPARGADSPSVARVRALDAELFAFEERSLERDLPEGATQEQEDAAMKAALQEHIAAFARIEKGYVDAMEASDDPRAKVLALVSIGDLRDAFGADLEDAPIPSYLSDKQAAVYAEALTDKAEAQYQNAQDAWDQAAEIAQGQPEDEEIASLLAVRRPAGP